MNARVQTTADVRPRVLHIVPALFGADDGIVGGAERYTLELARFMAEEVPTTLVTFDWISQRLMSIVGAP